MSRRCAAHGLMAAEDGRCVICRRGDDSPERGDSPTSVTSLLWTAVAGFLCLALVVGYWKYTDRQEAKRNAALVVADPGVAPARPAATAPQPVETQRPEPGGAILDEPAATAAVDPETAERALADAKRAVPIKLYSTSWCPHCKRARTFLERQGYAYEDHDIEASETDKALLRSINPQASVPTFDVGGHVVIGFDPQSFEAQLTRIAQARLKPPPSARR